MTQGMYTIVNNRPIAQDVFSLLLAGDTSALTRPGQFVNVRIDGFYLRRPLSVCAWREDTLTLIYKVVGQGTRRMATMRPGQTLDLLVGLGNGFDPEPARGKRIALIGGGVGVPPLYGLMEALAGEDVACVLGFRQAPDVFYEREFAALGARVTVTTEDGSAGRKGFVTDALADIPFDYFFACGPLPMLRAVQALGMKGQLSLEARMACGFGACMGCACKTRDGGYRRICADGPVFASGEVDLEC